MNAEKIETPELPQKKRMTILQLNRIGDIVQTAQMVRLLKEEHGDIEIALVARKQFANPVRFLLDGLFDDVFIIDTDEIFRNTSPLTLSGVRKKLSKFIAHVNAKPSHVSINLTFSKSSNYLHSLINSTHKVGPYYNKQAEVKIEDKWSQYLYATVMRGDMNPFNLVDLFKSIVGVKAKAKNNTEKLKTKNTILIHPFASQDRKRWKSNKWTEVIYKTLKENSEVKIHIVGANNDVEATNEILTNPILNSYKNRIVSHVGSKKMEEVFELMNDKTLFVGHDSVISHLAATKGVQSLTIALGNARVLETAPYSANNYILSPKTKCYPCFPDQECNFYQCHSDIPYQVVNFCIDKLVKGQEINEKELVSEASHFLTSSVDIFKTEFSTQGLLTLNPVISSGLNSKEAIRGFYRLGWLFNLSEIEEGADFPALTANCQNELKTDLSGIKHAFELCEFGKKYSRYILEEISSATPSLEQIKAHSEKIDEIDGLLTIVKNTFPRLAPIVDYLIVAKGNLFGNNIVQLSESAFLTYNEGANLFSVIYDLIEKTLKEANKNNKTSTKDLR